MIDLEKAKESFKNFLCQFDTNNPKISLKIVHTYGVVDYTKQVCQRMHLNEEDTNLCLLIALLHDIGRFEQVKLYDSFEHTTMSHAHYGCKLLFEDHLIRKFIKEDTYDEIIYQAIYHHSDYKLENIKDKRTLFFCSMIRDTDKLDNCRVKLEDPIEVLLDEAKEEVGQESISEKVWQSCLQYKSVLLSDRQTKIDYWVSYIAYFFDINFKETFQIILENDFVSKAIHRIPYTNPDTKEKMNYLESITNEYIKSRC